MRIGELRGRLWTRLVRTPKPKATGSNPVAPANRFESLTFLSNTFNGDCRGSSRVTNRPRFVPVEGHFQRVQRDATPGCLSTNGRSGVRCGPVAFGSWS